LPAELVAEIDLQPVGQAAQQAALGGGGQRLFVLGDGWLAPAARIDRLVQRQCAGGFIRLSLPGCRWPAVLLPLEFAIDFKLTDPPESSKGPPKQQGIGERADLCLGFD